MQRKVIWHVIFQMGWLWQVLSLLRVDDYIILQLTLETRDYQICMAPVYLCFVEISTIKQLLTEKQHNFESWNLSRNAYMTYFSVIANHDALYRWRVFFSHCGHCSVLPFYRFQEKISSKACMIWGRRCTAMGNPYRFLQNQKSTNTSSSIISLLFHMLCSMS